MNSIIDYTKMKTIKHNIAKALQWYWYNEILFNIIELWACVILPTLIMYIANVQSEILLNIVIINKLYMDILILIKFTWTVTSSDSIWDHINCEISKMIVLFQHWYNQDIYYQTGKDNYLMKQHWNNKLIGYCR